MSSIKTRAAVMGLAAASAVGLTLGIVLPIVIRSHQTNTIEKTRYQQFNGFSAKTNYTVGENVTLSLRDSNIPSGYEYQWYLQTTQDPEPKLWETTTCPSLTLTDLGLDYNHAIISCLLVPDHGVETQSTNFAVYNNAPANPNNLDYYAQTEFILSQPFAINSCKISVDADSAQNGVVLDHKDNVVLVPEGHSVTLKASVNTARVYSDCVQYQWYCNNQPISHANSASLSISKSDLEEDIYTCQVYLASGDNRSPSVDSSPIKVNVVKDTNVSENDPVTVTADGEAVTNGQVTAGNELKLTTSFNMGDAPLANNTNDGYTVSYTWYHNDQVISRSSTSPDLSLDNVDANDSGSYECKATICYHGGGEIVTSSETVNINVNQPGRISISHNLFNQTIVNGDSVTLNVQASVGGGQYLGLNYQWQAKLPNSNAWSNIGTNANLLNISASDAVNKYNGAEFRCVISSNDVASEIPPVTSLVMTLHVVNPKFSVSATMSSNDGLMPGDSVTLNASVSSDSNPDLTDESFTTTYGYQWFEKTNNSDWTPIQGATKSQLVLNNLTIDNNGNKYHCLVYPTNTVGTLSEQEKLGKLTKDFTLNLNQYQFKSQITITPISTTVKSSKGINLINNLGDKFNLSVKVTPENYTALPAGYSYLYQWQKATTPNAAEDQWTDVQADCTKLTTTNDSLKNVISSNAGVWYYRCVVKVVSDNSDTEAGKAVSNILETATYPKVVLNVHQQQVTIAHNAQVALSPEIKLQTSLEGTNQFVTGEQAITDLTACGATYKWTYNNQLLDENLVNKLGFVVSNSINTPSLSINAGEIEQFDEPYTCDGDYSLTVTVNGVDYTLPQPYSLTEAAPTFTVNVSPITVNAGATSLPLSANLHFNSNAVSHDQFRYSWYIFCETKGPNGKPIGLDYLVPPGWCSNSSFDLQLNGYYVNESWENTNKFQIYCAVKDITTGEYEWSKTPCVIKVNSPTIGQCQLSGEHLTNDNDSSTLRVAKGRDITLTASVSKPSFSINNAQWGFNWQYLVPSTNTSITDNWQDISPSTNNNIVIDNQPDSYSSTITIQNAQLSWSDHLKLRCVAKYYMPDAKSPVTFVSSISNPCSITVHRDWCYTTTSKTK